MKKYAEIKTLTLDELTQRLEAEQDNYQKLKFAHAITPIENPMKIKENRRLIARLKTQISIKNRENN
ncbi:MAG: 50S ribosomal protein L29 [Candidatus Cyclobacteriaceae bacterium M3_2C_046]